MPSKSAKPQPAEVTQMGMAHRQLEQPVHVGDISVAEAREIKALNELVVDLQKEAQRAERVMRVAVAHRMDFLRQLLVERGLPTDDVYNVSDDSGMITRTHEKVTPKLEVVAGEPDKVGG